MMLLTAGCSSDGDAGPDPVRVTEGKVEATISVSMPGAEDEEVESRAGATTADTDILNADALIFDRNGLFVERIPAASVSRDGDNINIMLLFDATSEKRIIHLVANSRYAGDNSDRIDFSPITAGCHESAVGNLATAIINESDKDVQNKIAPPVMWGRLELASGITKNMSMSGVKLLRACAAVTVKAADATPENGLGDFEILGATVSAPASRGYVTPTTSVGTAPTATPTAGRPMAGARGSDPAAWMCDGATPVVYVYERNCTAADYMGVVIKAKYKGAVCYYKMLMMNGANPYNIVRNHRYILTITQVTGRGYADLATAADGLPCNTLKASIVEAEGIYSSSTADQQYLMSMDCNVFEVFGKYNATVSPNMRLARVKCTHTITPVVKTAENYPWLTNIKVRNIGGNKYEITADFVSDGADHEGDLTVVNDNLELPLKVKWHVTEVAARGTNCYSVNLINPGEVNWYVKVESGQTATPWFGLTNSVNPRFVTGASKSYLTEINSRVNPGAWLHVNTGADNKARLRKSCADASGKGISAAIAVIRHN